MHKIIQYSFLLMVLISCKKKDADPVFPVEPYIEFRTIEFVDASILYPNLYTDDSLKVSFYFRDGDFDLGLSPTDTVAPFNRGFYFLKSNGSPISFTQLHSGQYHLADLLAFSDKRRLQPDTLPDFVTPYSCTRWQVFTNPLNFQPTDTIYFNYNPNSYNIYVDLLISHPDGSTSLFDFAQQFVYPNCYTDGFNGRFPAPGSITSPFNHPYKVTMTSSREGIMTYSMGSAGWKQLFQGEVVKVRIKIRDRALHISNEIETSTIQF